MTTIELSDDVMRKLEKLASMRDTSVPEALAEAIGLYEAAVTAEGRGGRMLIETANGRVSVVSPGRTAASAG